MRFYTLRAVLHSGGNRPVHMKQINYLPVYRPRARVHCEALREADGDRGEHSARRSARKSLIPGLGEGLAGRVCVRVNC